MKGDCVKLAERISAHLDGDVHGPELDELLHHLEACGCCQHCLDTMRKTRELLQKMPEPQMPECLKTKLKACLKNP